MNSNSRRLKILSKFSNHSYSIYQEEHTNLEKSMEFMIQFQSDPLDMIEVRLSRLENICRNKKTLPTQSLTVPDISSHIDENQESWYLEDFDQDSISLQNLELDQYQPIDKLTSFHFNEIEHLIVNVNPIPNFMSQFISLNLC